MTDISSPVLTAAGRLRAPKRHSRSAIHDLYATLADLAVALSVRNVIVAVDDDELGRQIFHSARTPLAESSPIFGLWGPPGVCTEPPLELDTSASHALVDAVCAALARTTPRKSGLEARAATPRDALLGIIEAAIGRAVRYQWGFTLVVVVLEAPDKGSASNVIADVRGRLRTGDVLTPYRDNGYALLLPATPSSCVPEILKRVAAGGPRLFFGLASCPAESTEKLALIALAEGRLEHARRAGC